MERVDSDRITGDDRIVEDVGAGSEAGIHVRGLELVQLTKTYGASKVVNALNLAVREGEFLTLLGPSGSGKSTTLKMIAGFVDPTSGDLRLDGRSIQGVPPERREVGMVFQNYALFPHKSVAENLAFPLVMRRFDREIIEDKVHSMLELLRLVGFGPRRPGELSGGQQQRVALGRALIFEPRLLLMDEPLGALDRALRDDLQRDIRRLATSTGSTTVYVTHDQAEALAMSDRIAVMSEGTIEQVGSPEQLYREPANGFVATFLGTATLCPGTVAERLAGSRVLVSVGGSAEFSVEARTGAALRIGQPVTVVLRPEDLRVQLTGSGPAGIITEEVFFGDSVRRRVEVAPTEFVVSDPTARSRLGVGTQVQLSAVDAWILPQ